MPPLPTANSRLPTPPLPVVLHHGLLGLGNVRLGPIQLRYFAGGIERAIASRGHQVIPARVHPIGSVARRARELKANILFALRRSSSPAGTDRRVIIFAHSMGGLDARYMISRLGMADRVAALVTISTPHHGSSWADAAFERPTARLAMIRLLRAAGVDVQAAYDLTTAAAPAFNAAVPDDPRVRYFSVNCAKPRRDMPLFYLPSFDHIHKHEGPNDGLVSARSAIWGTLLATWPVDHLHAINKRFQPSTLGPAHDMTPRYRDLLDTVTADIRE